MKLCKKCIYSKPVRQLGIVDWYCTFKEDWIGLPIDAMFCRNYITRISDEKIDKIVDALVEAIKKSK